MNTTISDAHTYKIVLVGSSGVGKTSFVKRHTSKEFIKDHIATVGFKIYPLTFHTNKGTVILKVWDFASKFPPGYQPDVNYLLMDGAIMMFSVTDINSYKAIPGKCKELRKNSNVPMVLCGNKTDLKDERTVTDLQRISDLYWKFCIPYYEVSVRSRRNISSPFLSLIQILLGKDTRFTSASLSKKNKIEIIKTFTLAQVMKYLSHTDPWIQQRVGGTAQKIRDALLVRYNHLNF